jgi:hypothetical protein
MMMMMMMMQSSATSFVVPCSEVKNALLCKLVNTHNIQFNNLLCLPLKGLDSMEHVPTYGNKLCLCFYLSTLLDK